ncbi:MAG: HAMP domain-containing sensor histidine kinase [Phycisphaerales bacterium]
MNPEVQPRKPRRPSGLLPRLSLRLRLTLWVVAIFTLIQWTTGVIFWLYQRAAIREMYEAVLAEKAEPLSEGVSNLFPDDLHAANLNSLAQGELGWGVISRYALDVFDEAGKSQVLDRAPFVDAADLPIREALKTGAPAYTWLDLEPLGSTDPAAHSTATIVYPFEQDGRRYVLVIAASDAFAQRQLALLERVLALAGVIGPLAAGVAGWFIAGVAISPLERLRGFASRLGPESIGEALGVDEAESKEVARLSWELEEARQRIQAAFKAQERFLSNVSHEIKTPISVMLIEAQTLPREGLPEDVNAYLDSVEEEMLRLGRLVESFLTLTRVQDGKGLTRELEYPANDMVMDCVDHCLALAEQYRVRLSPRLLEGEHDADTIVCGEPELLRTLLDNLVRNAIRFSPQGQAVEISMQRVNASVLFHVQDRGPGIPPDQLTAIFDRFAQTEEEQRRGRGHGLGLEIAQGIAELHGGRIIADNREGGGAVFTVTLPVKEDEDDCPDVEADADERV